MTLMINTTGVRFLKRCSNRGYTKTAKDTPEVPAAQLGGPRAGLNKALITGQLHRRKSMARCFYHSLSEVILGTFYCLYTLFLLKQDAL